MNITYRSFATRVSQLKIWHFWVISKERNICSCTFNRYSVITQFAKLAAGEQLCRCCTHRKLQHFKTFNSFSWEITNFELWHYCCKWAICTRWFKYDRDWFVCKQAALRSSFATLREWSHNLHPTSCSG